MNELRLEAREESRMSLNITSRAFEDGGVIPGKYTCDRDNISPPLAWSNVPGAAKELALILDDPDAPSGVFVHWVVYGLPATAGELEQAAPPTRKLRAGGAQGRNGFGNIGYGGPCPPSGEHRYFSHLYALDADIGLAPGVSRQEAGAAMKGHVLEEAKLMFRYKRQKPDKGD
jgi:Raf kinase inhibitor-like YbhB/YbcL family protein